MLDFKVALCENDVITNNIYDNEELFNTVICEGVDKKVYKSVFLMIYPKKDLSIFVMRNCVRKLVIEKTLNKNLNYFAIKNISYCYVEFLVFYLTMKKKESSALSIGKENCGITVLAISVDDANTNGLAIANRSAFNATFDKITYAPISRSVSIDKIDRLKRFVSVSKDKFARNNGVSVSIIYNNVTAIAEVMQKLLLIRKFMYSEKLII